MSRTPRIASFARRRSAHSRTLSGGSLGLAVALGVGACGQLTGLSGLQFDRGSGTGVGGAGNAGQPDSGGARQSPGGESGAGLGGVVAAVGGDNLGGGGTHDAAG